MIMFLKRKEKWNTAKEICSSKKIFGGINFDRFAILEYAWQKEIGFLGRYCKLLGIDGSFLVINPCSSAVASEISMKSSQIVRDINKYFDGPWIKGIKISSKI